MIRNQITLAVCMMLLGGCATAVVRDAEIERAVDHIDRIVQQVYEDDEAPGCSVMVVVGDEIRYAGARGVADIRTGERITPETRFRLASVSKQFTAMAILHLVDRGRLSLDETLTDVFPDFPPYGSRITVHHLLTHSSGLKDYEAFLPDETTRQVHDEDVLRMMMARSETDFTPGSRYRYSNSGYALLAMIVEARSGQRFSHDLAESVLHPMGIAGAVAHVEGMTTVANRAFGHSWIDGTWQPTDQSITSAVLGDGGVYMSVLEYADWHWGLIDEPPVSPPLLKEALRIHMVAEDGIGYGYGWRILEHEAGTVLFHGGSTRGFLNYAIRIPEAGVCVVVLTNRNQPVPQDLAEVILDRMLQAMDLPAVFR